MHDGALVHTTTDNVYYDSNQGDDTENAAGTKLLLGNLDTSTGCRGAGLEDIGAAVGRGNKGNGVEGSQRVCVAEQRDDGVLATGQVGRGLLAASLSAPLVVSVVFVFAVLVISVIVIVVVVVADNSSWAEGGCGRVRAWRTIGIVQDEFAATEDGLGALLAIEKQLAACNIMILREANYPMLYVFPSNV